MAKKGHGGHHGGAWKVAYADFVTAMMAFFMVLWLLSTSESTKAAVASYFRHPALFKNGGTGFLDQEGMMEMEQKLIEIQTRKSGEGETSLDVETLEVEKNVLSQSAQQLEQMIKSSPELAGFEGQINISFTDDGLRIQIEDSKIQSLFDVGSTEPNDQSRKLMSAIGATLAALPNPIVVEGHTDSRPYQGRSDGYSNWELSGQRANAARRILEASGVDPTRIQRVVGMADRELLMTDQPMSDRNRRISILVRYQAAANLERAAQAAGTPEADEAQVPHPEQMGAPIESGHAAEPAAPDPHGAAGHGAPSEPEPHAAPAHETAPAHGGH
ncbi:MAG: OmpA family protein [Candidatus Eisenbacteria bacterium]|nr:OmpA family protein [Candidatus Eisenbacteria bacterium]